jgi:NAD(P)-dependent dehydrogenase (short-subunit alcohol dehydrogenase family)
MDREFQDRHVVVTGGAGALGAAVAEALARRGAICHLPVRREVDLTNEAAVTSFYAGLPGLWASVHCAGGFAMARIADSGFDIWSRMWEWNASTSFLCSREAVRAIRRTARGGRIVNVAARPALDPSAGAGMTAYAASKAAVAALTAALAAELRPEGVWVNAVAPSILDTPANRAALPDADWSRWPRLDEVAELIVFLASPSNTVTSGAIVPAYGRA